MQKTRDEHPQVEVPSTVGKAQKDGPLGCVRPKHLVKDRLQQENAKGIEDPDGSQQGNAQRPLE
jgi:hypothetical protein